MKTAEEEEKVSETLYVYVLKTAELEEHIPYAKKSGNFLMVRRKPVYVSKNAEQEEVPNVYKSNELLVVRINPVFKKPRNLKKNFSMPW